MGSFGMQSPQNRMFDRYIGIDYSGAASTSSGLRGLRVFESSHGAQPQEVRPSTDKRRHWSRRGIAEWLLQELKTGSRSLVGIDHAFSFPEEYFARHGLDRSWPAFLDDFQRHWPTDAPDAKLRDIRQGKAGNAAARAGERTWYRQTELAAGGGKSVFFFDVNGTVAHSTHTGIPWLRFLRTELGSGVRFWPFDGWDSPAETSAIVEVYPSLWSRSFARDERTPDQHDAWSVAEWMRREDEQGRLLAYFTPSLSAVQQERGRYEGWILGAGSSRA